LALGDKATTDCLARKTVKITYKYFQIWQLCCALSKLFLIPRADDSHQLCDVVDVTLTTTKVALSDATNRWSPIAARVMVLASFQANKYYT
jgi:hypothetical protein